MKLVMYPAEAGLARRIEAAAPGLRVVVAEDEAVALREIADADALYGQITAALLAAATRLRWVQSPVIGLERTMFPELVAHSLVLTNPRGLFSEDIADHVLGFVLLFARGFHRYVRQQSERNWAPNEYVVHLPDATLGVFGLGGIGLAVAERAHAHGMRVLAVDARRTERPTVVAELMSPDRLTDMLGQSDFVAICAPETPETRGLFDERVLGAMRPNGYLINIGRGKIVRLDALVAALREERIAGAGLDVFEIEPLPADHPLWGMENVVITPHVAGFGPHVGERRHQILLENARRFVAGEPLSNVVDKGRWF